MKRCINKKQRNNKKTIIMMVLSLLLIFLINNGLTEVYNMKAIAMLPKIMQIKF